MPQFTQAERDNALTYLLIQDEVDDTLVDQICSGEVVAGLIRYETKGLDALYASVARNRQALEGIEDERSDDYRSAYTAMQRTQALIRTAEDHLKSGPIVAVASVNAAEAV